MADEYSGGRQECPDGQSHIHRRKDSQGPTKIKLGDGNRAGAIGFDAQQCGNQITAQEKEDSDAQAPWNKKSQTSVGEIDQHKSDRANSIQAGNVSSGFFGESF